MNTIHSVPFTSISIIPQKENVTFLSPVLDTLAE